MSEHVDLALWEVTAGVLQGIHKHLRVIRRSKSDTLRATYGECGEMRVLIAQPARTNGLAPGSRLASLQATHRPTRLIGVGAVADDADDAAPALLATRDEIAGLRADWPRAFFDAADQQRLSAEVLVFPAPAQVLSLLTSRAPVARRLGRFVGSLLPTRVAKEPAALAKQRDRFLAHVAQTTLRIARQGDD